MQASVHSSRASCVCDLRQEQTTTTSTKQTDAADRYYERGYAVAHLNARGDAGPFFELPDAVKRKATVPKTRSDARLLALVFRVQDGRDALS